MTDPSDAGRGAGPADLSDRDRRLRLEAARNAVKDLIEELKTLRSASAEIGNPLTREAIEDALSRRKSDNHTRVQLAALSWAATACCNQLNAIIQAGSVLAGFREPEAPGENPLSVTVDYRLLRDNGVITQVQRQLLSDLNAARIGLTHRYGQSGTPDDLYRAGSLADEVGRTFGADYGDWLRSLGVVPPRSD